MRHIPDIQGKITLYIFRHILDDLIHQGIYHSQYLSFMSLILNVLGPPPQHQIIPIFKFNLLVHKFSIIYVFNKSSFLHK